MSGIVTHNQPHSISAARYIANPTKWEKWEFWLASFWIRSSFVNKRSVRKKRKKKTLENFLNFGTADKKFGTCITVILLRLVKLSHGKEWVCSLELEIAGETCIECSSFGQQAGWNLLCILCSVCLEAGAVGRSICHLKTNPRQHLGTPFLPIPASASTWTPVNPTGHHQATLPYRCLNFQTFTGF